MKWLTLGTLFLKIAHLFLMRAERAEVGENAVAKASLKFTTQALLAIKARDGAASDDLTSDQLREDDGHRID